MRPLPSFQAVGRAVPLDELPRHTPWPARLLQGTAAVAHVKDRDSILREFDRDKWGSLLAQLEQLGTPDLATLQRLIAPSDREQIYIHLGSLFLASAEEIQNAYLAWLVATVEEFGSSSAVAELGGGAGNLLLHLARQTSVAKHWISYELTTSGRAITEHVALCERLPVVAGAVDFERAFVRASNAPSGGLYFSSFALAYCADPYRFLSSLLDDGVSGLLLIEPMYQLYDEYSLLGLLARRYIEYNGYSRGVWPAVQRLLDERRFEIAALEANFFGHNPLCPVSAVQLTPPRR
jgi:hypothetical protein